uniref:G protein-coupled receptor n=1 Tax=Panagrellus redivivus TaxID=6233 RepID=A0A7E4W895_PANRE
MTFQFHFPTLIYLATVSFITTSSVGILTWFNIRVAAHLRAAKAHMHGKTIRLQQQITWQLNLQSVFPALCSTQTFAFVFIIVFTPDYSGGMFMFIYAPYAMLPVLNPLTTLLCISQYRRQLCQIVRLKKFAVSSTVITPSNKAPCLVPSGSKMSIIASK